MTCMKEILKLKGDKEFLPCPTHPIVVEGGGEYKGFDYLITFVSSGSRCGYVALQDEVIDEDIEQIDCHGSITFNDTKHAAKKLLAIPCEDRWIGFDSSHFMDKRCPDTISKYFADYERLDICLKIAEIFNETAEDFETHKTYDYMEKECHSIIDQLIGMKNEH